MFIEDETQTKQPTPAESNEIVRKREVFPVDEKERTYLALDSHSPYPADNHANARRLCCAPISINTRSLRIETTTPSVSNVY